MVMLPHPPKYEIGVIESVRGIASSLHTYWLTPTSSHLP